MWPPETGLQDLIAPKRRGPQPKEAPNTIGINHKPTPELIVPYWIDGLGSSWESALHSEAKGTALAYCGVLPAESPGYPR